MAIKEYFKKEVFFAVVDECVKRVLDSERKPIERISAGLTLGAPVVVVLWAGYAALKYLPVKQLPLGKASMFFNACKKIKDLAKICPCCGEIYSPTFGCSGGCNPEDVAFCEGFNR